MRRLENINEYKSQPYITLHAHSQLNMCSVQYIYEYFSKFNSIAKYLRN